MEAFPREACGILLGTQSRVEHFIPADNVHQSPETRFEIDPGTLIDAFRAARNGGPEVVGYFHSHPAGPAEPSRTDRALSAGDGKIWAIMGQDGRIGWFRAVKSGFVPLSYELAEG